jgi:benzodiazapine receptor
MTLLDEVHGFYTKIAKPRWTPPSWAFGVAWSILYPLMGAASYLLFKARCIAQIAAII